MQAVGHVIGCLTNAKSGLETQVFQQKNLIMHEGADIMAGLLSGDMRFVPSHMYFLYENTNSPITPPPELTRADGRSFFASITGSSPNQDWLRVPIITRPRISIVGEEYSGNVVTFSASSAASDTLQGESPAHNYFGSSGANGPSKVFSLALVAGVNPNTNREDKIFSRLNLQTPMSLPAGHHLTFYWMIKFQ
jgi:hypothetical protein